MSKPKITGDGRSTINSFVEVILIRRELKTIEEVNYLIERLEEVYLTVYGLQNILWDSYMNVITRPVIDKIMANLLKEFMNTK